MNYSYTSRDLISDRENYMYSDFCGVEFMRSFVDCRIECVLDTDYFSRTTAELISDLRHQIADLVNFSKSKENDQNFNQIKTIEKIFFIAKLIYNEKYKDAFFHLEQIIHRFEVSKKLFEFYTKEFSNGSGSERNYWIYLWFGLFLAYAYFKTEDFQYLSSLLKLNDIMISVRPANEMSPAQRTLLDLIVCLELQYVEALR